MFPVCHWSVSLLRTELSSWSITIAWETSSFGGDTEHVSCKSSFGGIQSMLAVKAIDTYLLNKWRRLASGHLCLSLWILSTIPPFPRAVLCSLWEVTGAFCHSYHHRETEGNREWGRCFNPSHWLAAGHHRPSLLSESLHYRTLSVPGFQELILCWPDWARGGRSLSVIRVGCYASLLLYSISITSKILCILSTLPSIWVCLDTKSYRK